MSDTARYPRGEAERGAEPVLWARDLTKVYQMGDVAVHALRGVSVDFVAGELVVLLGPSGSGKSTLLNILGGLDVPTGGRFAYRDRDLTRATEGELTRYRRQHVGFVFQFYNLVPSLTVRENVQLVADIADDPMDATTALELVGLGERLEHFPAQISGGEQQRVAIARAIVKRPQLLLCDEPTGALDFRTGVVVLDVLSKANRELGATTLIITHNVAIGQIADRIIHFSDGRVAKIERVMRKISPLELAW